MSASAAEQRASEFNSNTMWAFASFSLADEKLFAGLATRAEHRVGQFNAQGLTNTAWAMAAMKQSDGNLLTESAGAAERGGEG